MAKGNYLEHSESSNWNVAKSYSDIKIMKWLELVDDYEMIAEYGALSFEEEFLIQPDTKTQCKVTALYRLHRTLLKIIDNTLFALKKNDKVMMGKYKKGTDTKPVAKI